VDRLSPEQMDGLRRRPRLEVPRGRAGKQTGLIAVLRSTVTNGAVVPVEPNRTKGYFRVRLKREGLMLHTRKMGTEILAWCERRD